MAHMSLPWRVISQKFYTYPSEEPGLKGKIQWRYYAQNSESRSGINYKSSNTCPVVDDRHNAPVSCLAPVHWIRIQKHENNAIWKLVETVHTHCHGSRELIAKVYAKSPPVGTYITPKEIKLLESF